MLPHSRLRPSGSITRNSTIRPPNMTSRRFGMILSKSLVENSNPPMPSSNQQVTIGRRAQMGAEPGAGPADDDHGEVIDRDANLELLVVGDAEIVGVEHAGDARVERRDREREQLVAEDVDADDFRRGVVVAHGDEGA